MQYDLTNATTAQQQHEIQIRKTADANEFLTKTEIDYQQKLIEIDQQLAEVQQQRADAAQQNKDQTQKRIFDMVQEKMAADGIIDTNEYEYLQNLAVAKGLITRAAADQAMAENKQADELVRNFSMTQPRMDQSLTTMKQIAAYDGKIVQFGVNFTTSGDMYGALAGMGGTVNPGGYSSTYTPYAPVSVGGPTGTSNRDSGGSGVAGRPYMIGTGAQPELFVPSTNGAFYPNANSMGATYNVVIYNPKKETAEDSIRKNLKSLSFTGAIA